MADEKRCTKCGQTKPFAQFSKNRDGLTGPIFNSACKPCHAKASRAWNAAHPERMAANKRTSNLRVYGLTIPEYDELLARQDGCCAICGTTKAGNGHSRLPVDHDHVTGRVRGLLCHRCNRALGLLGDDLDLLRKAIKYLEGTE